MHQTDTVKCFNFARGGKRQGRQTEREEKWTEKIRVEMQKGNEHRENDIQKHKMTGIEKERYSN